MYKLRQVDTHRRHPICLTIVNVHVLSIYHYTYKPTIVRRNWKSVHKCTIIVLQMETG